MKSTLGKKPDQIILHAGTNDIGKLSPSEIADNIVNLAREIESSTDAQVIISELVTRLDLSASGDVDAVNKRFRKFCNQPQLHFIRHDGIHSTYLNRGGLHLGETGIAKMYNNFANKLDECNRLPRRPFNSERNSDLGNLIVSHEFLLSKRGFKLASLNINSLSAHIDELRILHSDRPIDILAINELNWMNY